LAYAVFCYALAARGYFSPAFDLAAKTGRVSNTYWFKAIRG